MKPKFDDNTELLMAIRGEKFIDVDGREKQMLKWMRAEKDINLGSLVKPNKDIALIKYRMKPQQINLGDLFGGLFGK